MYFGAQGQTLLLIPDFVPRGSSWSADEKANQKVQKPSGRMDGSTNFLWMLQEKESLR